MSKSTPNCHSKANMFCKNCSLTYASVIFHNRKPDWCIFYSKLKADKKGIENGMDGLRKMLQNPNWVGTWEVAVIIKNDGSKHELERIFPS